MSAASGKLTVFGYEMNTNLTHAITPECLCIRAVRSVGYRGPPRGVQGQDIGSYPDLVTSGDLSRPSPLF